MTRENLIRKEILFQLYAIRPRAASPDRMFMDAKKSGYDYTLTEIKREAEFITDEELIFKIEEKGTTCLLYRIHANGIRHYEQYHAE